MGKDINLSKIAVILGLLAAENTRKALSVVNSGDMSRRPGQTSKYTHSLKNRRLARRLRNRRFQHKVATRARR
jgi:hypothetical protein